MASSADFAQQALVHLDALYNFAVYLSRNGHDADDLVQETYLRAFRFAHQFEPGTNLRAWLFQILMNTFRTFYRHRGREPVIVDQEWPEASPALLENEKDWEVMAGWTLAGLDLEKALGGLSSEFRSALLLADLEGFHLDEIALIMDCPVGTVKSRLFRARRLLREALRDYDRKGK